MPITSDLGDTITGALANSDYLIVICSPRTSESLWVQREIQTFLQTHDRRRVLTVLAEGEPQDTIPEILRSEEVVDPETGEARSVPLEPLSCDWRLPLRRARREELPRMVALLLDCAYDELRQRQRQYRMRRLTAALSAAFALALGFIGYMLRTNALIRDNYEDALRNQSRYLANESLAALEEGDRLTAALLAMEALPGSGGERPLVPEAEYAINQAVGTYESGIDSWLVALSALMPEGKPKEFLVDDEGMRVLVLDDLSAITAWDLNTLKKLWTLHPPAEVEEMQCAGANRLLVRMEYDAGKSLICCDLGTGEELWSAPVRVTSMCPDVERGLVYVCHNLEPEWSLLTNMGDDCFGALSLEDGSEQFSTPIPKQESGYSYYLGSSFGFEHSPDGRYVAFGMKREVFSNAPEDWYVYDAREKRSWVVPMPEEPTLLFDLELAGDGRMLVFTFHGDWSEGSYISRMAGDRWMRQTGRNQFVLHCLDIESGEVIWRQEVVCYQIPNEDRDLTLLRDGQVVQCVVGDLVTLFSIDDGEVLVSGETQSSITGYANYLDDCLLVILEDGSFGQFLFDSARGVVVKSMEDELKQAYIAVVNDHYLRYLTLAEGSERVMVYGAPAQDAGWQPFEGGPLFDFADGMSKRQFGQLIINVAGDGKVVLWDLDASAERWRTNVNPDYDTGEYTRSVDYGGMYLDEAGGRLMLFGERWWDTEEELTLVDLATGAWEKHILPRGDGEEKGKIVAPPNGVGGRAVYGVNGEGETALLYAYDPESKSAETFPLWEDGRSVSAVCASEARALAVAEDGSCLLVSLEDGTRVPLEQRLGRMSASDDVPWQAAWSADGSMLAGLGESELWLWNASGELQCAIPWGGRHANCLHFDERGQLYVLCTDGMLFRYDRDGGMNGSLQTRRYESISSGQVTDWIFLPDGDLALCYGAVMTMIDTGEMAERFYVEESMGYDAARDRVICYRESEDGEENYLGACPRYSVEELIEKGWELVGDVRLSATQREAYGLS